MNIKDIKIGMKVVPHSKTGEFPESDIKKYFKEYYTHTPVACYNAHGYCVVSKYNEQLKNYILSDKKGGSGDFFNASDFEPYHENKTQNPPYSKLQAKLKTYCDNNNVDFNKVYDLLFKKPVEVKEDKPTFEVGEMVNINPNFEGNCHSISKEYIIEHSKNPHKIILIEKEGDATCVRFEDIGCYWNTEMLLKIPQPQKEKFVPYLKGKYANYGEIGKPTLLKDIIGRELFVGDTVELFTSYLKPYGEYPIANDNDKDFIMSIEYCCNKNGTISDDWKIIKKRSYQDIKNGEMVGNIKYILEEMK